MSTGDCWQVGTTVLSAVRDVKASSSGASGNSLVIHVEASRSVPSRSTIAIAASIVDCKSALPSACAQNVRFYLKLFIFFLHLINVHCIHYQTALEEACIIICSSLFDSRNFFVMLLHLICYIVTTSVRPYLTSGVDRLLHCPALRPYQLGPMRVTKCNHKITGNSYKAIDGCEAINRRL